MRRTGERVAAIFHAPSWIGVTHADEVPVILEARRWALDERWWWTQVSCDEIVGWTVAAYIGRHKADYESRSAASRAAVKGIEVSAER